MSFEDNRKSLKAAVDKMPVPVPRKEAPATIPRKQPHSYTLSDDVAYAIKKTAAKEQVSASYLVDRILSDYFDL